MGVGGSPSILVLCIFHNLFRHISGFFIALSSKLTKIIPFLFLHEHEFTTVDNLCILHGTVFLVCIKFFDFFGNLLAGDYVTEHNMDVVQVWSRCGRDEKLKQTIRKLRRTWLLLLLNVPMPSKISSKPVSEWSVCTFRYVRFLLMFVDIFKACLLNLPETRWCSFHGWPWTEEKAGHVSSQSPRRQRFRRR